MASSGIRLGAWHYLRWGHIKPVEKERAHFDTGLMYKITRYNTTISQEKIVRTEGCSEVCPDTTHIKGTGCAICGFLGFRCNTSGLGLTLFGVLKN
jgi:hypothetical protein